MANRLEPVNLADFTGGLNLRRNQFQLAPNESPEMNNINVDPLGGIYTRTKAVNWSKMPFLADIPIIGWFFKNKNEADTRSEVLIFLTPKIVNRASSIGG